MTNEEKFKLVTVKVYTVKHETDAGILVVVDTDRLMPQREWLPKSQIAPHSEVKHLADSGTLIIPKWLAVEKGLPYEEPDPNAPPTVLV